MTDKEKLVAVFEEIGVEYAVYDKNTPEEYDMVIAKNDTYDVECSSFPFCFDDDGKYIE